MTKAQKRRRDKKRRFEAAGAIVLGRAHGGQALVAPSSILRWVRGALVVVLVVAAAGALWLWLDDRFYVQHADVAGAVRVSPDEVFQASGLQGLHILWAHPAQIEARILAALPSLESAQVVCKLPARCTISVAERQPMVMWDENGQSWWVDTDGVVLAAQGMLPEGWLVQGPLPRDENGRLDERVRVALNELWETGANVPSVLQYVPGRGLVFTDARGWRVIVGEGAGMAERLRVLEWLAADLQARGLTPRFVDVRFPDAPYYSLTNDW